MTESNPTHFLCSSTTSSPAYTTNVHSGKESILLQGGFSARKENFSHPLSATLQLNADLGVFTEDALNQIAIAEHLRITSQNYRSYSKDIDTQLAVISHNPETLSEFVERYGGFLEITPLLKGNYAPDCICVEELQIEIQTEYIALRYTTKTPISLEQCTYCGLCGPVCPEECLYEDLFLNFSKCSMCGECEAICPQNAIQLSNAEEKIIEAPALLLLDNSQTIDLPEERSRIFQMSELDDYFATLFASRIDEVIICRKSRCQYIAKANTSCELCVLICPQQAIKKTEDTLVIDQDKCTECGQCLSVCPTGAMEYQRFSDKLFVEYISRLNVEPGSTLVIGEEKDLQQYWWRYNNQRFQHTLFLEYPSLAALNAMHLLLCIGQGFSRIILLTEETTEQQEIAAAILASFFESKELLQQSNYKQLASLLEQQYTAQVTEKFQPDKTPNRRSLTSQILHFFLQQTEKTSELSSSLFDTFGTISCDQESCTSCFACLNVCKIQALSVREQDTALLQRPSLCVQCAACVSICPENALRTVPGLHLNNDFFAKSLLSQAEPIRCPACNKAFGSRKSFEKVLQIMRAKKNDEKTLELLQYCEDCRIIKLYETGEQA